MLSPLVTRMSPPSDLMRPALKWNDARVLAANVPEKHTVPTGARYVKFKANADFYVLPLEASEDDEAVTNGDFAASTGWTVGTGWAIAAGKGTHTSGTAALSRTSAVTLVAGRAYKVTYTISGRSAGTVAASVGGGTAGAANTTDGTYTEYLIAGATQIIALTPNTSFDGSVDDVSVTAITAVPTVDMTDGNAPELNPEWLDLKGVAKLALVTAASAAIVTMAFFKATDEKSN